MEKIETLNMPDNCKECKAECRLLYQGKTSCRLAHFSIIPNRNKRPKWCPLILAKKEGKE